MRSYDCILSIEIKAERFRNAFDDPEFRKMFSDYDDEIQDPQHRAETEVFNRIIRTVHYHRLRHH